MYLIWQPSEPSVADYTDLPTQSQSNTSDNDILSVLNTPQRYQVGGSVEQWLTDVAIVAVDVLVL